MGFAHCRPLLGLDGTHIKTRYQGILLAATGVDANGSLFPLAYAVVDAENNDNWLWMLQLLRRIIQFNAPHFLEDKVLTILSDRQKGLISGVDEVFPASPHGYCLRHLYDNFNKQFKNPELKKFLWQAAEAKSKEDFNAALDNMTKINVRAVPWLLKHAKPEHWADLYFSGKRYGHYTSNIAESLNSWILEAREMPILAMFESIRHKMMDWFAERRQQENHTHGLIISKVAREIQRLIAERARRYRYIQATDELYEVKSKETLHEYIVNLALRACSCREWQSNGYPCGHALAVILSRNEDPQTYTQQFFTLEEYRQTYSTPIIHPRNHDFNQPLQFNANGEYNMNSDDSEEIEDDVQKNIEDSDEDALPPNVRRQPGRPRKERLERKRANNRMIKRVQKCALCREQGHSKRTCKKSTT